MTWKNFRFVAVFASLALAACADLTEDGRYSELSFYGRGKFHYDAGQFGLAVKHFRSAVDREPGSVKALNGLAASYDRLGRYDLATKYYGRALGADPESTQTLNNIGYSYLLQKRFDLAVAYLRDAHSRDRNDPVIQANRMVAEVAHMEHEVDAIQRQMLKNLFVNEGDLTTGDFFLWTKLFKQVGDLSNLAERLAHRVRRTLELKK